MSETASSSSRLPTLNQMRTFLAVVETGTLSLAARRLNLTQPAVSQQIGELERCLGQRLLERLPGGVIPTAAGSSILEPVARLLKAAEDVVAAASEHGEGGKGRLRLGMGAASAAALLPEVLAEVKQALPRLDIRLEAGSTPDLLRAVEEGDLDLVIVTLPIAPSRTIELVPVLREPMVAVLPTGLDDGGAAPLSAADLCKLPLILDVTGAHTRRLINRWFAEADLTPLPMMEIAGIETIRQLVRNGLGATILPQSNVDGFAPRSLSPPLWREMAVAMRADKRRDRGLRVFLDALHRSLGDPCEALGQQG